MRVWTRLRRSLRHRLGLPPALVKGQLLGQEVLTREGTIRAQPDYDDAWIAACATNATTIFDVGANVGYDALLMLIKSNGIEELVAIEANTEALVICAENMLRNGFGLCTRYVSAFASDKSDEHVQLWTVGTGSAGSMYSSHAQTAFKARQWRHVQTLTLDRLAEQYGLLPDFVKIDVEGAESRVLDGSINIATQHRTRFLVEMHSNPDLSMSENGKQILRWCEEMRYAAWYLAAATRLETVELIRRRGRCHLLLQPQTWPYPAWLKGISQGANLETAV